MFANRYEFWSWRDTFAQTVVGLLGVIVGGILIGLAAWAGSFSDGAMNWPSLILQLLAALAFATCTVVFIAISPISPLSADVAAVSAIVAAFALAAVGYDGLIPIASVVVFIMGCSYATTYREAIFEDDEAGVLDLTSRKASWGASIAAGLLAGAAILLLSVDWFEGRHLLTLVVAALWYDRHVVLARRIAARKAGMPA